MGTLSSISAFQSLNKLGPLVVNKKIRPLFKYNYACILLKKWPYFFDLGTLSAISAFQSLNKLGPLVADHKTGYKINAYIGQDKSTHVSSKSDKK